MRQSSTLRKRKGRARTLMHINIEDSKPVDPFEYLKQTDFLYTRAIYWELLLGLEAPRYTEHDILATKRDLPNQRVIRYDVKRTRALIFDLELHDYYNSLITFYVKREGISYKQGLNELGAPFIVFKKADYPLERIYQNFAAFIDMMIPNIFSDDEFMTLQCCFIFFNQLLRFHDVELQTFLMSNNLTPELYTTPWFITLFASKSTFKIAQLLFEFLMILGDRCFMFYFNVAVLIYHKSELVKLDQAILPQQVTGIKLHAEQQLFDIIDIAMKIRLRTPASFEIHVQRTLMFVKNYAKQPVFLQQMQAQLKELEKQDYLQIFPFEIFYHLMKPEQGSKSLVFFNFQINCPSLLCHSNRDFIRVVCSRLTDQDQFKQLLHSLSPVQQRECNHCFRPRRLLEIPPSVQHNKQILTLYRLASQYEVQNQFKSLNLLVLFLNFAEKEAISQHPNIKIIEVSKLNQAQIENIIARLNRSNLAICLVLGKTTLEPSQDLTMKYKAFRAALTKHEFNYVSIADEGCEEFFNQLGQLVPKERTANLFNISAYDCESSEPQERLSQHRQSEALYPELNSIQVKHLDPVLQDLNLSFMDQIKKGIIQYHQDCNVTIPNKTFYSVCVMYDKENFMIVKHNGLVTCMIEQSAVLPSKRFKLFGMFPTNQMVHIRQNKNVKSISIIFVAGEESKLQKVLQTMQLLKRQKKQSNNRSTITVTVEFKNPMMTILFKDRMNKCLLGSWC